MPQYKCASTKSKRLSQNAINALQYQGLLQDSEGLKPKNVNLKPEEIKLELEIKIFKRQLREE